MRRSIAQEDPFGCGIACVAFVNGIGYKSAKKRFFKKPENAGNTGFLCKDLVKALSIANKDYNYKYMKRRMKIKNNTIVFIKRSKFHPKGHYLVKSKIGWMDPWINFDIENPDVSKAVSGFRKRLPGKAIYAVFPK